MSSTEKAIDALSTSPDNSSLDPEKSTPQPLSEQELEDDSEYLTGIRLGLVVMGLCLSVLLVGLDNSILATVRHAHFLLSNSHD
jgi:hypothetical protein